MANSGIKLSMQNLSPRHRSLVIFLVILLLVIVLSVLSVVGILALVGAAIGLGARLVYRMMSLPGSIKNRLSMKKNKEIGYDPGKLQDLE